MSDAVGVRSSVGPDTTPDHTWEGCTSATLLIWYIKSMVVKATFGAGCFWHVEEIFLQTPGVMDTKVGYTGGHMHDPSYRDVCTDRTGHAEAVQVEYDPERISYDKLLEIFWRNHDPTTPNRQGPDIGTQYRSAIFCHSPEQERQAHQSARALNESGRLRAPVVTQIVQAGQFYKAEEYHQRYFRKMGMA